MTYRGKILLKDVSKIIKLALEEDLKKGDITSEAIFKNNDLSSAEIISKQTGIFCGSDLVKHIYSLINPKIKVTALIKDGNRLNKNQPVIKIMGPTKNILAGERIALNFIQRMSGIASKTNEYVSILNKSKIKILDTRKTGPGLRLLDKYAVKTGGGTNHRMGLYDLVMIKDNHLKAAGSLTQAVELVRKKYKSKYKIEVEVSNLKEVEEARTLPIDIIMLDNMNKKNIQKAINLIAGQKKIEVSGTINQKKLKYLKDLKVDFISVGSLTHSVQAFDFSLKFR